jgi:undecaprenyl-diphosphatase
MEPLLDPDVGAPPPHPALAAVTEFDDAVDRAFDRLRGNAGADRLFYGLSELADFSLLWHLIGVARAAPTTGATFDQRAREAVELSVVLGAESLLVNGGIKRLFRRQRPVHEGERPHRLRQPLTTSFPSGHASAAFCAAAVLSRDRRLAVPAYGLATLVAASRVHVRIHHASDVVGGAVVGVTLGFIARKVLARRR